MFTITNEIFFVMLMVIIKQLPTTEFLSSQLGIGLQIAAVMAVLFSSLKYLSKKLDDRINSNIESRIQPVIKEICKQIAELRDALLDYKSRTNMSQEKFEAKTNTAISYIDRALMSLQGIKDDNEIKDSKGYC